MEKKGLLICVEGVDQSGKKTQVDLLVKRLNEHGFRVEEVSFPDYDTMIGKEIEAFLKGKREYNSQVRHMLYAANRWERREDIESWLNKGELVVVDRYYPSNLAYGLANGLDLDWLLNLEKGLPDADLVIVIDVSTKISFNRKRLNRDVYERDFQFLREVREAYIQLSKRFNWRVLEGGKPIESIHNNIWQTVRNYLKEHYE